MDLFAGAAHYYARYRLPYPAALFDLLVERFGLDGASRVLDLGTGTGQLAIPLAARCGEVVALDISAEMIAEGVRSASKAGATTVRWSVMAAEDLPTTLGLFQLVTIGAAFHWMDRDAVLARVREVLTANGGIALAGMETIWGAPEPWAQAVTATVRRWLGDERRAGAGVHRATRASAHRPFGEILADAGFVGIETGEYRYTHHWDLDHICGYLYSTSYCRPDLLAERRLDFEADLRQTLLALDPAGDYPQELWADYTLGWRQ
ncbi:MAG TPA: class I SAM-dependent methyltransferase [Thermomicrobiales bacterium]|jgi:SAM-dependent methyltransferase